MDSIPELHGIASLTPASRESLIRKAYEVKRQYFGDTISLYAPIYLANFCENACRYCGFHTAATIRRKSLNEEEIVNECQALFDAGLQSVLLLTGESRQQSSPQYIRHAVKIAGRFFPQIALEVYPLTVEEYADMRQAGIDGVTIYQETYDQKRYAELHLSGPKRDYAYRLKTPERVALAGIRQISLGVLLGLADWRDDLPLLFAHLRYLEKKYPGVEYSLSFPRLRQITADDTQYFSISDDELLAVIATARILFPRIGINISTREAAAFRDKAIFAGATRISAGSSTVVGGYANGKSDEGQFAVSDTRPAQTIKTMLKQKAMDPVITDWR
ncbi:MAG: 2-iminoacetate synthase ThiH [Deltaproteobacteria bacterium]|nr:2-iminoacetate synthase ThiH [Deltaproteobacteria bacterium]